MRGTSFTDVERLARQKINERVACTRQLPPSNDRSMSRRNRVRTGTAQTLRRMAAAVDLTN